MNHRISLVPYVYINSVSYSSIFEIGDSHGIDAKSRAIAVQREYPLFLEGEANFRSYRIFSEDIPLPSLDVTVKSRFIHDNPIIKVKSLEIVGTSNASVIQIGSTHQIKAEARVKHIRQLLSDKDRDNSGNKE